MDGHMKRGWVWAAFSVALFGLGGAAGGALQGEPEAASSPDGVPLAVFESAERSVRLSYPEGWSVTERAEQFPYVVTAKPQPLDDQPRAGTAPAVELFKYYHASASVGLDARGSDDRILKRALEIFERAGVRALVQEPVEVQGALGRLIEAEGADPDGAARRILLLLAVKDDVLAALSCRAPVWEFASLRALYHETARRLEPFSRDPARSDNAAWDRQTATLENDGIVALQNGETDVFIERFEQAKRLNPGNPTHAMNYGSLLYTLGEEATSEQAAVLFEHAKEELRRALALFDTWGDTQMVAPLKSQTLYVLGGIARRQGERRQARAYLEEAMRTYPHPEAQDALKRYE